MIVDTEAREARADTLSTGNFNGIRLVIVELLPLASPDHAQLFIHFYNDNHLEDICNEILADPDKLSTYFNITGGYRLKAGSARGQVKAVQTTKIVDEPIIRLDVKPIGDYSTYTLHLDFIREDIEADTTRIDPIFSEITFKFRPGCFTTECDPELVPAPPDCENPIVDYLAKDYDSFRYELMNAMRLRVPGWEPTTEADFSQVLIDLFAAAGDELSDYQDRVMNEAYFPSVRNRVSLARHARLMDYHIHQGNQSSTWLALTLVDGQGLNLPAHFAVWSGSEGTKEEDAKQVFLTRDEYSLDSLVNSLELYTWSDSITGLSAGATSAELAIPDEATAISVRDLISNGDIPCLLIQEHLNPLTGREAGRQIDKRQILKLLTDNDNNTENDNEFLFVDQDPLTNDWYLHVTWRKKDQLKQDYCFIINTESGTRVDKVVLFHGNLVEVYQGRATEVLFKDAAEILNSSDEYHYERATNESEIESGSWKPDKSRSVLCRLPDDEPLIYFNNRTATQSDIAPQSTLEIIVEEQDGTSTNWEESINLIHSQDNDKHFAVETDELNRSIIRFGNGENGTKLPDNAVVHCWYQSGYGIDGNLGSDRLTRYENSTFPQVESCWNPFDITNGYGFEPVELIIRNAPEAFRAIQLRAITLEDYVDRAEQVDGVSRAAAKYVWTGSWRAVQIVIDPESTTELSSELSKAVAQHLEVVRLIGDDIEIRSPIFVPVLVNLKVCICSDYWPEDVRFYLEKEFSSGYTPDGRLGFFHPDNWTFSQSLRRSEIVGRAQAVTGVSHVLSVIMRRFNAPDSGTKANLEVSTNEIIQVMNDPDHVELGMIRFELEGGRR